MNGIVLRDLRLLISQHFNLDELHLLAFDLNVDWDELAGTQKSMKIQELIIYLGQHGRLENLAEILRQERPFVEWPDMPPIERQKKAARAAFPPEKFSPFSFLSGRADIQYNFQSLEHLTNRENVIFNVRHSWIEHVLEPALYETAYVELKLSHDFSSLTRQVQYWEGGTPAQFVTDGRSIRTLFEKSGRSLLILGVPGSGKTFTLLELCQDMLQTAEQDPSAPIPVVLNLSTWTTEQKTLTAWIIEQMYRQYQLAPRVSQAWLGAGQICLLLDGLDEIQEDLREKCVFAINECKEEYPLPLVVCSRKQDYEALAARLNLSTAVVIQPLNAEQVNAFLADPKLELSAVTEAIQQNDTLQELSQTPLMLSIMALALRGMAVNELRFLTDNKEQWQRHLFNAYTRRMFTRVSPESKASSPRQSLTWLSYLARQLTNHNEVQFFLENLQTDWLRITEQRTYYRLFSLAGGLTYGMMGLLLGYLMLVLGGSKGEILFFCCIVVFFGGANFSLTERKIKPVELVSWRRRPARKDVLLWLWMSISIGVGLCLTNDTISETIGRNGAFTIIGLMFALSIGLGYLLVGRPFLGLVGRLIWGLASGLSFGSLGFGLVYWWFFAVLFGLPIFLVATPSKKQTYLNQGIQQSGLNAIRMGLFAGFTVGLPVGLLLMLFINPNDGLIGGLAFALFVGLTLGLDEYGGKVFIAHYLLRWIMYRTGQFPLHIRAFLDAMSTHILLQRASTHYRFIHRSFQEYFAGLSQDDIDALAEEIESEV